MDNFRTDLALERRDVYKKANKIENDVDGIESEEETVNDNLKVTRVRITNQNGENAIGKKIGNYITIDINRMNLITDEEKEKAEEILAKEIKKLVDNQIDYKDEVLVIGLGNKEVTPDALGPNVLKNIEITRHIINYLPQYIDENARPVSGIAPGVLGTTGIETVEIVRGIVENIKPKLLIVIDALASRSIKRISSTIQISDTGIVPGGGVENTRKELTKQSLGIPVIAIGIPTVVDILFCNALNLLGYNRHNLVKSGDSMKKIVIKNKVIIQRILENKSNCNEMTLYIMGKDEKLVILKTDTLKRRVYIPIEKVRSVIKNI